MTHLSSVRLQQYLLLNHNTIRTKSNSNSHSILIFNTKIWESNIKLEFVSIQTYRANLGFASRKTVTQREIHLSESKMLMRPPVISPTCNTPPPTLSGWWCRNLSGRPSILANQSITFISSSVQAGLDA